MASRSEVGYNPSREISDESTAAARTAHYCDCRRYPLVRLGKWPECPVSESHDIPWPQGCLRKTCSRVRTKNRTHYRDSLRCVNGKCARCNTKSPAERRVGRRGDFGQFSP